MPMIEMRRDVKTTLRTSPEMVAPCPRARNQIGVTIWFEIIVERAIAATITIEVAEENPPKNANIARPFCSADSGRVSTKRSGFDPAGKISSPTTAIGITNSDMSKRYSGKAQLAVARWLSSEFSTTIT